MHKDPQGKLVSTSETTWSRRDLFVATSGIAALAASRQALSTAAPELPISSRELWGWVRAQQVLDPSITYLDTSSGAPTLRAALVTEYRAREAFNLDIPNYEAAQFSADAVRRLATRMGTFVGCDGDELSFTTGATEALTVALYGLDFAAGDEIVTTSREHPALSAPLQFLAKRRGIVIKQVDLPTPLTSPEQPLGLLAGAVTERTRVLAFSHIQADTGALLPVKELCAFARQRGIISIVDGAQAVGGMQVSLRDIGCDIYAASLHKWLSAPYGTGLLYIRREMIDRVWPLGDDTGRTQWPLALRRYGNSLRQFGPLYQGVEAVLDFYDRIGLARIEARIRELAIYARLRLQQLAGIQMVTPSHPSMWAGLLCVRPGKRDAAELAMALAAEERVIVSTAPTSPEVLRISTHIYNSHDDVEKLVRGLQRRVRA